MRRHLLVAFGVGLIATASALPALAQSSKEREDDAKRAAQEQADRKKKQKAKDWNLSTAPLPGVKNAGPCPYVKVLYDASRYVELKDNREAANAVGWTGEIENINSECSYKKDEPITIRMRVNFAFGKGPQASGEAHGYRYWVAVTARKSRELPEGAVLAKTYFDLPVGFDPGADRMAMTQAVESLTIPRANRLVTGDKFEVLVGFDVTPQMAEFNREGKRFRVNAVGQVDTASTR